MSNIISGVLIGISMCCVGFAVTTDNFRRCTTLPGGIPLFGGITQEVTVCGFKWRS